MEICALLLGKAHYQFQQLTRGDTAHGNQAGGHSPHTGVMGLLALSVNADQLCVLSVKEEDECIPDYLLFAGCIEELSTLALIRREKGTELHLGVKERTKSRSLNFNVCFWHL